MDLCTLVPLVAAGAASLSPATQARIERDLDEARAEIRAQYGGRSDEQLTAEERRALDRTLREKTSEVLRRHQVSEKDFERAAWRRTRAEQERVAAERKRLEGATTESTQEQPKPREGSIEIEYSPPEEAESWDEP